MTLKFFLNTQMIWMNTIQDIYNPNKKHKTLIIFDDTIADMLSNKKLNPMYTELFTRGRKLNILFLLHNVILLYQKILD